jgi:hypothetical protein
VEDGCGATEALEVLVLVVEELLLVDASSLGLLLPAHAVNTNVSRGIVKLRIRMV